MDRLESHLEPPRSDDHLGERRVAHRAGGGGRGLPTRRAAAFSVILFFAAVTVFLAARTSGETRRRDPREMFFPEDPRDQRATKSAAGVACTRRHRMYEIPHNTPVPAAQPHASGPSPTEKCAMSADTSVIAKPA